MSSAILNRHERPAHPRVPTASWEIHSLELLRPSQEFELLLDFECRAQVGNQFAAGLSVGHDHAASRRVDGPEGSSGGHEGLSQVEREALPGCRLR